MVAQADMSYLVPDGTCAPGKDRERDTHLHSEKKKVSTAKYKCDLPTLVSSF